VAIGYGQFVTGDLSPARGLLDKVQQRRGVVSKLDRRIGANEFEQDVSLSFPPGQAVQNCAPECRSGRERMAIVLGPPRESVYCHDAFGQKVQAC
jgi:hypothetical protein